MEGLILKKDSYPQPWRLSLPKANLPNDLPGGFRGLKIDRSLDDLATNLTVTPHQHSLKQPHQAVKLLHSMQVLMINLDYTNLEMEQHYSERHA